MPNKPRHLRGAPWVAALIAACLAAGSARAAGEAPPAVNPKLETIVLAPDFWGLDREAFARKINGLEFYWVSQDKAAARSQARFLTFNGLPVVETIVRFSSNGAAEVKLSFFNRGDVGQIGEEEFYGKVAAVSNLVGALAGAPGRDVTRRADVTAERRVQAIVWAAPNAEYRLETACTRIKDRATGGRPVVPEFVNLTIKANQGQVAAGGSREGKARAGFAVLRQKIKRLPNGDIYLDPVPMVDQGQKGYCAVAAAERVLRYYGLDVDQHAIAQKANTSTGGAMGTDARSLLAALKAIAFSADLQLKVVERFDVEDFVKQVRDYNLEAKRNRVPEIVVPQSGTIDVVRIYQQMDKRTFLQSRSKGGNAQVRFANSVQDKVNSGYPLFWGVTLGFVEETVKLPQVVGGHMRLIIGYNSQTREILYTDSWGPGHELKRLGQQNAFAITACLFSMEP